MRTQQWIFVFRNSDDAKRCWTELSSWELTQGDVVEKDRDFAILETQPHLLVVTNYTAGSEEFGDIYHIARANRCTRVLSNS